MFRVYFRISVRRQSPLSRVQLLTARQKRLRLRLCEISIVPFLAHSIQRIAIRQLLRKIIATMATLVRFQSNDGADITIGQFTLSMYSQHHKHLSGLLQRIKPHYCATGLKAANRSKLFRALREDEPDEPILDFPVVGAYSI